MVKVEQISSTDALPAGQHYILVKFGETYAETRDPLGLTITVARRPSSSCHTRT